MQIDWPEILSNAFLGMFTVWGAIIDTLWRESPWTLVLAALLMVLAVVAPARVRRRRRRV